MVTCPFTIFKFDWLIFRFASLFFRFLWILGILAVFHAGFDIIRIVNNRPVYFLVCNDLLAYLLVNFFFLKKKKKSKVHHLENHLIRNHHRKYPQQLSGGGPLGLVGYHYYAAERYSVFLASAEPHSFSLGGPGIMMPEYQVLVPRIVAYQLVLTVRI